MTASRNFYTVRYVRLPNLLGGLASARTESTYRKVMKQYRQVSMIMIPAVISSCQYSTGAEGMLNFNGRTAQWTRNACSISAVEPHSLGGICICSIPQCFTQTGGSEFDNMLIDELLDSFQINRSLSMKGCPYDNAVAESTFKMIKADFVYSRRFETLDQLQLELLD